MDKERVKGALKKATGKIKEKAGRMTRDPFLEQEGRDEQVQGRAHSAVGHAKDAVRELVGKK